MPKQFEKKGAFFANARKTLTAAPVFFIALAFAVTFTGCGAVNIAAEETPKTTVPSVPTSAAPAVAAEEPVTEAAPVAEISDADVDADLMRIAKNGSSDSPSVASVAGSSVTLAEYRFMLNTFKSGMMLNSGIVAGTDEDLFFWTRTAANGKTRLDDAREKVFAELHKMKVCALIAGELGITLGQDEFENISTDIRAQENRFDGRAGFEKVLKDEYEITLSDYWLISELTALRQKLLDAERETIAVSEDEARAYFDENPDIFGDLVKIRQILYYNEGLDLKNPRTEDETKKLAEDAMNTLLAGADADGFARGSSEEQSVSVNGGEHIITRGDEYEPEEILIWAFGAEVGECSVIQAAYGYYVVLLEDKIIRDFDEMKPDIENMLKERRLAEIVAGWVGDPAYALVVDEDALARLT